MSTPGSVSLNFLVADPAIAAQSITAFDIPYTPELEISGEGFGELIELAHALQGVDKKKSRIFFHTIGVAECALALNDAGTFADARAYLAGLIDGMLPSDWDQTVKALYESRGQRPNRKISLFADAVLPHVQAIFTEDSLKRAELNTLATREWPEGSGRIHVPEDGSWRRRESLHQEYTAVQVGITSKKEVEFLIKEGVNGLTFDFIREQRKILDRPTGLSALRRAPLHSWDLPAIFNLATNDTRWIGVPRFILHTYQLREDEKDEERYWLAFWVKQRPSSPPEILILTLENTLVPFKHFVRLLLKCKYNENERCTGIPVFEPVDLKIYQK